MLVVARHLTLRTLSTVDDRNKIARQLRIAKADVEEVLNGTRGAAYIMGGAGVGKSKVIADALKGYPHKALRFEPATTNDLYQAFYDAHGRRPIVLEDGGDFIWRSRKAKELLRNATDLAGPRATQFKPPKHKEPTTISLKAPLIVSSNATPQGMGLDAHTTALFNRAQPTVIDTDRDEMVEWALYLGAARGMLETSEDGRASYSAHTGAKAMEWFWQNQNRLDHPSPRTLRKIAHLFHLRSGALLDDSLNQFVREAKKFEPLMQPTKIDWTSHIKGKPLVATAPATMCGVGSTKTSEKPEPKPAPKPSSLSDFAIEQAKVRAAALVKARGSQRDIPPVMQACIRDLHDEGLSRDQLSKLFGINPASLNSIVAKAHV